MIDLMNEWFASSDNVISLGSALVDAGLDAKQLQDYYEKPWKWDREWKALQMGQSVFERVLEDDFTDHCGERVPADVEKCGNCGTVVHPDAVTPEERAERERVHATNPLEREMPA